MVSRCVWAACLLMLGGASAAFSGGRIFNAQGLATLGQFPYLVYLKVDHQTPDHKGDECGGTIIHPRWILTASHCFTSADNPVYVFFSLLDKRSITPDDYVDAKRVILHKDYSKKTLLNDIALLELYDDAPLGDNVKVTTLPEQGDDASVYDGKMVCLSGMGKIGPQERTNVLQWSQLHMDNHTDCIEQGDNVDERRICTDKTINSGPCPGDSGGPLALCPSGGADCQCNGDDVTVIGVVSYSLQECNNPLPEFYTNIAAFRGWIKENTGGAV